MDLLGVKDEIWKKDIDALKDNQYYIERCEELMKRKK